MRIVVTACLALLLAGAACGGEREGAAAPTATANGGGSPGNVLHGGGPEEKATSRLTVAAAADLRDVLLDYQAELEEACDTSLTFVFGSSGQLKTQIEAGAPFGLYLSADIAFPRELQDEGLIAPNGVAAYGVGRIVLATRPGLSPVPDLSDLTRADIKRVAIANPAHAPYGRAAKAAMERVGVYEAVRDRLVMGENIRQTADYVEQGDADAAIVALALVVRGSPAAYTLIDASLHDPIVQGGAVIEDSGGERTARCVLQQLLDEAGQQQLKKFGFEPAPR